MREYSNVPMTLSEVAEVIKNYNFSGGTAVSVGLFLSGRAATKAEAAKAAGVTQGCLTHAMARITDSRVCQCCEQQVKFIRLEPK